MKLPVKHGTSCLLSGLNDEIQKAVFRADTLHDAYCLAKLQEANVFPQFPGDKNHLG